MTTLVIAIPPPPTTTVDSAGNHKPVTDIDFYLWKRDYTKAQDLKDKYEEGMKTAYHNFSLVLSGKQN
jgi:hypothetical protein